MSGTDELKNMLLTFRVSELQMLLGYAGQNKTGRKTELQARALDLLKNKSIPHLTQVHTKIRELYKSIQTGGNVVLNAGAPVVNSAAIDLPQAPTPPTNLITNPPLRAPLMSGFLPITDQIRARNNQFLSMYGYQPKLMTMNNTPSSHPILPLNPDVRFKRLPFYDLLGELLKPSTLTVQPAAGRDIGANFVFFLTPKQASEISMNREVGPGTRNEYVVQVQMRFCLLETAVEQEDAFPPGITVKVNGKLAPLPSPLPTNKQGNVESRRPSRPVNISHLVKLCPSVPNSLSISWNPDFQRGYVVSVNLVKKLNAEELLQRLKNKGARHADYTTGLIKDKLSDSDNDIATTVLRVSLICPLGKMRMITPCRSSTCTHLQCFDAAIFLSMNEKRPTWTCPVCNKPALYDNLVIDGYFQDVLNSTELGPDCAEIQLNKDGSWCSHDSSKESPQACPLTPTKGSTLNVDSPSKSEQIEEIIDDNDDEARGSENGENRVSGNEKVGEKEKDLIFVDLTTSDSEDDERPPPSKEAAPPPPVVPPLSKLDHAFSDTSSSLSTTTRSPPSIINLDSPSPSPPLPHNLPSTGFANPPSNYMCHMRLAPDSRYHPY